MSKKPSSHNPVLGTLKIKPVPTAGFRFSTGYSAKTVPMKYVNFKPAKIVKTTKRWYVEYYYLVPIELKTEFGSKKWMRFRIFEDINRYRTDEYAEFLKDKVNKGLEEGYSPFAHTKDNLEEAKAVPAKLSLNVALDRFIQNARDKGLRSKTIENYGTVVNYLRKHFLTGNKIYEPVTTFVKADIKKFLIDSKKANSWQNYTYNNYLGFTQTIFNWFVREEIIEKSPASGIDTLPVNITRHKYYDNATAEAIKKLMIKDDPLIYKLCMFIYYSGTRPKSEARFLRVGDIINDRNLIFIPANISKNKKDDYIQLDPSLKEMLAEWMNFPKEYYLFGSDGVPAAQHTAANFFSRKYKVFKDKMKLSEDFSIYAWKHTRAIHLAEAGANPYEIQKLFRHHSLEMTVKYLRDLGCNISTEISDKSRKF